METNMAEDLRLTLSLAFPHEVRTPLHVILGISQYLLEQDPANFPAPANILALQQTVHTNALQLYQMLEKFLFYTKLRLNATGEADASNILRDPPRRIQTAPFIGAMAGFTAQTFGRRADLQLDLRDIDSVIAEADLERIVAELVENACKFSPAGSPVRVCTSLNPAEQRWTLNVQDQGSGLTRDQLAAIAAYMELARRPPPPGIGLGLAIVRFLTEVNAGALSLESQPQQGTTVRIAFQRAPMPST